MKSIVVFCGSSEGGNTEYGEAALALGSTMAEKDIQLVYGGAKIGIMGKVAEGVLQNGGKVIGVIPVFLKKKEVVHEGLTQLIVTQNMHERKLKMHELSEGIIMLPGGFGTLEEFFEMLTWSQLGLHQYPIGILNTNGFYDSLLNMMHDMVQEGFVKQEHINTILVDNDINALLNKIKCYVPLPTPKWIKKDQL
ncbi:LOG family protein [Maribacter litoralis]|uniref:Cytokinin riboside 5'-monophosphate phosphoribohydrolase n=1 Tax=Maribacter litoralis TaxID=2059726 RepID=A0A653XRU3_9FLAO|nr:TIGR00730 family Rossman fold protein [Maribacter litoralis]VXC32866.1 putative cytokinin riboside 5'-monophosphate phosphoribohydrolase [Maribacter litoralis]